MGWRRVPACFCASDGYPAGADTGEGRAISAEPVRQRLWQFSPWGVTRITAAGSGRDYKHSMESVHQTGCSHCRNQAERSFCAMPPEAMNSFSTLVELAMQAKGTQLFAEGRSARGVYILCEGRARLSICAESGKRVLLRVAGAGELLGLEAALSGGNHEMTAELIEAGQVGFVKRRDLLKFLKEHPLLCLKAVRQMSDDLHGAYEHVRSIGLNRNRRVRTVRPRPLAS